MSTQGKPYLVLLVLAYVGVSWDIGIRDKRMSVFPIVNQAVDNYIFCSLFILNIGIISEMFSNISNH